MFIFLYKIFQLVESFITDSNHYIRNHFLKAIVVEFVFRKTRYQKYVFICHNIVTHTSVYLLFFSVYLLCAVTERFAVMEICTNFTHKSY